MFPKLLIVTKNYALHYKVYWKLNFLLNCEDIGKNVGLTNVKLCNEIRHFEQHQF